MTSNQCPVVRDRRSFGSTLTSSTGHRSPVTDHWSAILPLLLLIVCGTQVSAQFDPNFKPKEKTPVASIGVGLGLDYGGIGACFTGYPDRHIGIFAGVGYALAGVGYNVGAKIRLNHAKRFGFVFGGMYGYNAAIKIAGSSQNTKLYYGPSLFVGGELAGNQNSKNFLSMGLCVPFRPSAFTDDLRMLKGQGYDFIEPPPIAITVGYHFGF